MGARERLVRALVDSSVLIALARPKESRHQEVIEALSAEQPGGLAVPVTILSETMSFLGARVGIDGQRAFWDAFMRSDLAVSAVDLPLMETAREIDRRYADAGFGFADCTLLAACEATRSARIYTFDTRLAAYRPSFAPALQLLP